MHSELRHLIKTRKKKESLENILKKTSWLYGFPSRNPYIKLRNPEPTSLARIMNFNRSSQKYFRLGRRRAIYPKSIHAIFANKAVVSKSYLTSKSRHNKFWGPRLSLIR